MHSKCFVLCYCFIPHSSRGKLGKLAENELEAYSLGIRDEALLFVNVRNTGVRIDVLSFLERE